jgi:hypothetical protein
MENVSLQLEMFTLSALDPPLKENWDVIGSLFPAPARKQYTDYQITKAMKQA